ACRRRGEGGDELAEKAHHRAGDVDAKRRRPSGPDAARVALDKPWGSQGIARTRLARCRVSRPGLRMELLAQRAPANRDQRALGEDRLVAVPRRQKARVEINRAEPRARIWMPVLLGRHEEDRR